MRRVPIRLKLAAALSVPLFALTVVTALEVVQAAREADEIYEQSELGDSAIGPSGLITALQNERTYAAVDIVNYGVSVEVAGYEETRADTDAALEDFRAQIARTGGTVEDLYTPAIEGLEENLDSLRTEIDTYVEAHPERNVANPEDFAFASDVSFAGYTGFIQPLLDATSRLSLAVNDAELRQGTELASIATDQIEVLSVLASETLGAMVTDSLDDNETIARIATLLEQFERNASAMQNGTGDYTAIAESSFPTQLTDDIVSAISGALNGDDVDTEALAAALDMPEGESYYTYQTDVAAQVEERANELRDAARNRQQWFIALAVLVLGTAVTLTVVVSLSITRPLRALTRQAKDMAERRLPEAVIDILETPLGDDVHVPTVEPVTVRTRDEVADVSNALNTVQDTALDLAVEQAVLRRNIADSFVNLGRRNQNLLGRQLDFITELESRETDADTLANLFRLDHLATRMRRNAESLLVLAGIEPPRQWAAPVQLTDVIRAALGEVEDYQRVTVRGVEPATIVGSAAADLAHLLAELIENALVFSPPDQSVDIRGQNRPDGYTLAVIDSGLGMPPTDINAANRRLAGAESFTIAPSKYLGHYVAGNLAARHDIHVTLENSPGNGITATVDIPPTLLTTDDATPTADEPHAARDVWPPAPGDVPPATTEASAPAPFAPWPSPPTDGSPPTGPAPVQPAHLEQSPREPFRPAPYASPGTGQNGGRSLDPMPGGPPNRGGPRFGPPADAGAPPFPTGSNPARPDDGAAAAHARRTASGLVKRTPRVVDTGEIPALGASPDDTLLASISRVTTGRPVRPPADDRPPTPGTPSDTPAPPLVRRDAPVARHADRERPTAPRRPAGAPLGGLAAGLSGLSPFDPRGRAAGDQSLPPTPDRPVGRSSSVPQPGGAPEPIPATRGETTSGGLTRRVRGAQMPSAAPLSLRRTQSAPQSEAAPQPGRATPGSTSAPPARSPEQQRSADSVYSFLTSFTAGVQRGLDESDRT